MSELNEPVSLGEWMITMLLLAIPVVNIILILVWAFGGNTKASKANFFRAYIVFILIGFAIGVLFASSIISIISSLF